MKTNVKKATSDECKIKSKELTDDEQYENELITRSPAVVQKAECTPPIRYLTTWPNKNTKVNNEL